jgi:hypothetical protein
MKKEFLNKMGSLWDRLQEIEKQSKDMCEFKEEFENYISSFRP